MGSSDVLSAAISKGSGGLPEKGPPLPLVELICRGCFRKTPQGPTPTTLATPEAASLWGGFTAPFDAKPPPGPALGWAVDFGGPGL